MSRGHGTRQRAILAALTAHAATHPPMDDFDTDGQLHRGDVPPSFMTAADLAADTTLAALESTKRALRKLKAANTVELCHGFNHMLGARITPPEDVRERWWLALEDHQFVERVRFNVFYEQVLEYRARLKLCRDDDSVESLMCRVRLAQAEELVRMTYAETKRYLDAEGHLLPSQKKSESDLQPPAEEEQDGLSGLSEFAAAFGVP